ncbi:V-type ATP synthase subunit F [candidate division KSB3 bacterium]|uniref:V-type ATP synthase subunit F n=1 Tax=candidate division KSB3 bacterium TaxID=2044937 RepID=A0A9D5JUF2_9BACT|nr:V-type ATP synthase subunit F [candidate division KSB3 bacterium]MBD3324319.1 V-type ATP synthase subunit F [candidate division KSB3 bacterium]
MYKVLVITDREIGAGFRLTGIDVLEVSTAAEAETLLKDCLAAEGYGMILINEDYVAQLELRTRRLVEESTIPLVIPIPVRMAWEFEGARSEYLDDIVKRTIGYQISFH